MVHEVLFLKEEYALKHANMEASDKVKAFPLLPLLYCCEIRFCCILAAPGVCGCYVQRLCFASQRRADPEAR
jgi:hypothetical protein